MPLSSERYTEARIEPLMNTLLRLAALVTLTLTALGSAAGKTVIQVDLDRAIHPLSAEIVEQAIEQASAQDAAAVLVRLDTPGGLLSATEDIIEAIVDSKVPVIAYVAPSGGKAASAGFLILISADVAAMAPGTRTGAASPVPLGGGEMDETMRAKVENDAAASVRAVADKRGRNAELAQSAVIDAKAFTEEEALESNLVDVLANDVEDLLETLDGRTILRFDGEEQVLELAGADVVPLDLSFRQRTLLPLTDPGLAFIILALGALGVYIEFSNPGLILPGVLGGIGVLVGLMALSLLPINWAGAGLLVLGVGCLIAEAFVTSGGILAVGGSVAMILGAVMLIDTDIPQLSIGWGTAVAVTVPFAAITVFLLQLAVRSFRYKVSTGSEGMVGETGVAKSEISADGGQVFVHGELWSARSRAPIAKGAAVRVVAVEGLKIDVEPAGLHRS